MRLQSHRPAARAVRLAACALPLALAACAGSLQQTPPGVVRDRIQDELRQAQAAKPAPTPPANLDLFLLPPCRPTRPARPRRRRLASTSRCRTPRRSRCSRASSAARPTACCSAPR